MASTIIGSLGTEFILKIHPFEDFYFSVILTVWLLAFEFGIMKLFKKKYNSARILTIFAIIVSLLILGTSYYVGYFEFVGQFVIPVIVIGTMISNFILAMVGQASNTLVYLLLNVLVGIVPYMVFYISGKETSICWCISLIVSVILIVGAIIFKGRVVLQEIQKRFSV